MWCVCVSSTNVVTNVQCISVFEQERLYQRWCVNEWCDTLLTPAFNSKLSNSSGGVMHLIYPE
jgi:hypothetical protein